MEKADFIIIGTFVSLFFIIMTYIRKKTWMILTHEIVMVSNIVIIFMLGRWNMLIEKNPEHIRIGFWLNVIILLTHVIVCGTYKKKS